MKYNFLTMMMFLGLSETSAFATEMDFLSINGYGTIGGAYQDNKAVLYRDSYHADKGSQGDFSFDNYTLLGLQLVATPTDKLSFTLQGIASANNANGKLIDVEWANAKYQLSDTLDIRAGLMRLPTFMFSDILHVAYSYDGIRLPDMYGIVSLNRYTGVEFAHRLNFNDLSIFSTLLYGETTSSMKSYSNGELLKFDVEGDDIYGVTSKALYNDLTFRVAYIKSRVTLFNDKLDALFTQFDTMGISSISTAIQRYKTENSSLSYLNVGARYDFSNSYLWGEYIQVNSDSFLPDITSWNISTGYSFETWTPYISYSHTENSSNYQPISTEGVPLLVAGAITGANQAFSAMSTTSNINVKTLSLGFRYDLSDNMLLKFQYDDQKKAKEQLHIFSTAINFVF